VRSPGGYGLVLGEEVQPRHREAVLAHEIAHFAAGDLLWEPLTDGPARVLLETTRGLFRVLAVPFVVAAAPLGKATELNADRLAARAFPGYADTLREVADKMGPGAGIFYPSLAQRARHAARHSKRETQSS
jgi:Zn-dependent protease with chaperone function